MKDECGGMKNWWTKLLSDVQRYLRYAGRLCYTLVTRRNVAARRNGGTQPANPARRDGPSRRRQALGLGPHQAAEAALFQSFGHRSYAFQNPSLQTDFAFQFRVARFRRMNPFLLSLAQFHR